MKAKITRIEDGKVWAKTINPFGETPEKGWFPNNGEYGTLDQYRDKWHVKECLCKELPLHPGSYYKFPLHESDYEYYTKGSDGIELYEGREINVIEDNNFFKIV